MKPTIKQVCSDGHCDSQAAAMLRSPAADMCPVTCRLMLMAAWCALFRAAASGRCRHHRQVPIVREQHEEAISHTCCRPARLCAQVIRPDLLRKGFEHVAANALAVTDDVSIIEAMNLPVRVTPGSYTNIKVLAGPCLLACLLACSLSRLLAG